MVKIVKVYVHYRKDLIGSGFFFCDESESWMLHIVITVDVIHQWGKDDIASGA